MWTAQLVSRVRRDEGNLAYRQATGRRTSYDEQVHNDLRALALAAVLLGEDSHHSGAESAARREEQRTDWP